MKSLTMGLGKDVTEIPVENVTPMEKVRSYSIAHSLLC